MTIATAQAFADIALIKYRKAIHDMLLHLDMELIRMA